MTAITYEPAVSGGWLALCSPHRVLMIEGTTDAALITSLHAAVREDGGIRSVLDLLARNGLAAIPSFALAEAIGDPRVIVRGEVTVTAAGPEGERSVSGAGVTTWSEQVLPGATTLEVSIAGASRASEVGPLEITDGIVWVASLSISARQSAPVAAPPTTPAPVLAESAVVEAVPEQTVVIEQTPASDQPAVTDEPASAAVEVFRNTVFKPKLAAETSKSAMAAADAGTTFSMVFE